MLTPTQSGKAASFDPSILKSAFLIKLGRTGADRRRRRTAGRRTSAERASLSPLPLGRDRPLSLP